MTNLFSESLQSDDNIIAEKKIKKVTIQNYRNIDYKEYNLDGKNLLLTSKNGLGKTNVLEAIYWAVTGYLFDGTAKSESQGIKPDESADDIVTSVKLDFMHLSYSFERKLRNKYSKKGDYKGTETTLIVNGAPEKDQKSAINKLTDYLGLSNIKNTYSTNSLLSSINLFALLYNTNSLRTMDYKDIRAIITDMVGEADFKVIMNENAVKYQSLVEPLKAHALDLDALKKSTRSKIFDKSNGLEKQCENIENLIKEYEKDSNITIDKEKLEQAKADLVIVNNQIKELETQKKSNTSDLLDTYNNNILKKRNAVYERENVLRTEHNNKLESLKDNSLDTKLNLKNESLNKLKRDRISLSEKITTNNGNLSTTESNLRTKKNNLRIAKEELESLKLKRKELTNPETEIFYTCPKCGEKFDIALTKEYKEELQPKLNKVTTDGKTKYQEISGLNEGIESLDTEISVFNSTILKLQKDRNQLDKNISNLEDEIFDVEGEIAKEKKTFPELDLVNDKTILDLKKEIDDINSKKETLVVDNQAHINNITNEIQELESKRTPLLETTNLEVIAKSYKDKAVAQRKLLKETKGILQTQQDIELLIKELEKNMFERLDQKLTNVFGNNVKFKLWKKNLDDTYDTRMCDIYVKDIKGRFINIKNINTAMKAVRTIELISIIKDFYKLPKSFILIDELGTLDNEHREYLKSYGEQIFATEMHKELTTVKEIIF